MSSTIESVLQEKRVFPPASAVVKQANISGMDAYRRLVADAERDFEGFWSPWVPVDRIVRVLQQVRAGLVRQAIGVRGRGGGGHGRLLRPCGRSDGQRQEEQAALTDPTASRARYRSHHRIVCAAPRAHNESLAGRWVNRACRVGARCRFQPMGSVMEA